MEADALDFKRQTGIDPFKDLLGGLSGPGAFYLLPLGDQKPDTSRSLEDQVLQMVKLAFVVQVANPKQAAKTIQRFNQAIAKHEKAPDTRQISGADVSLFHPEPGITLSWGLKGDTAFLTLGEGTPEALAKILPEKPWSRKAKTGAVADGRMDFAVLTEAISSAVARGVGGNEATQFRTLAWPMLQQVLSRLDRVACSARLVPRGILFSGSLTLR
jgi:hypothetical protein